MTFSDFKQRAFEICESVKPGCYAHVTHGAYKCSGIDYWHIATDALPTSDNKLWWCEAETPEAAIALLEEAAKRATPAPEYIRSVAEALGVA